MIRRKVLGATFLSCCAILGSVQSASADSEREPLSTDRKVSSYTATEILDAAGQSSDRKTDSEKGKDAKANFLERQMRSGRAVDNASLQVAELGDLVVVWEDGATLAEVNHYEESRREEDGSLTDAEAFETIGYAIDSEDLKPERTPGYGMQGAMGLSNAQWIGGYCADVTGHGNRLTSCWQKYKINETNSTYDYWYYNRWATGTGKQISWGTDYSTVRVNIHSRPWHNSSSVVHLVDYAPRTTSTLCNSLGKAGVSWGAFTASVPMQECSEVTPGPNANQRRMGATYDQGFVFGGRIHGADFSMIVDSWQGHSAVMADYNYAKFCRGNYLNCKGLAKTDNGW